MNCVTNYRVDHSRERQLWCAVIERAVEDATRRAGWSSLSREQLRDRQEARRWFAENGAHYRMACDSAGIDPDLLRKHVLRMSEAAEADEAATHAVAS